MNIGMLASFHQSVGQASRPSNKEMRVPRSSDDVRPSHGHCNIAEGMMVETLVARDTAALHAAGRAPAPQARYGEAT
jgi:hypothetical protein